jgi:hypothetical protein
MFLLTGRMILGKICPLLVGLHANWIIQMARYKTFAGPFGKVFLGAVLVYQVIYWTWLKLETDESKLEKNGMYSFCYGAQIACADLTTEEMSTLEKKARELAGSKK